MSSASLGGSLPEIQQPTRRGASTKDDLKYRVIVHSLNIDSEAGQALKSIQGEGRPLFPLADK
jgi:hypothetical protein